MPFQLNPEVSAALAKLMGPNPPPPPPVGDVQGRRDMLDVFFAMLVAQGTTVDDVSSKDFSTKATDGHEIVCRWYTKNDHPQPGSAILYAHGGGMIALTIKNYDEVAKRYVSRTGVPFMLVEYRLAPEVQAPTPVTDVYAGLQYLVSHAGELGVDPARIGIMGDSAGGGITASLAHYIKLKGGPAVKKQILIYPMLDDRVLESDPHIAPYCTWTADDNKTGWGALLGDKLGKDDVDPIEAAGRMTVKDAAALPPCYMDVGELDLFRDEDIEYAQTLGKAGVECEFHLIPGVPHAFEGFAPEAEVSRMTFENRFRVIKRI
jgi:acetyl esterase/lipase